ncbi:calcium-independent phospholipase A2-gamma [Micropterus dolomieu]|uniref:calcium-independent phospholipase A2-gamma n=1 Tax=Micropterus dolomieu TaxID=147949 RepID=UPI001E8EC8A2|nr:calcium-independent phospholipase A2-gamma [Micropterus dolomieu]XP_045927763.1 calcium-independent phospholipase A2-gamma [Micropterus dolomieu]XP_045927764.1 calcium-independent phospholipase A2-gamma [Micropterus dolomieu]XP_045927765.1 calcium-independent phospholipase A2-gamma [Micropterus dolomieu]
MSRIRTTLDSVTKAVGSTDLIAKFSRLKPGSAIGDSTRVEKVVVKAETVASNNTASPPETTMKDRGEEGVRNTAEGESDKQRQEVTEKPFVATPSLASAAHVSAPSPPSTVAKQTMQVFHPASLSTNMDETYKTLAQHINSYFGSSAQEEGGDDRPPQQHRGEGVPVSEPINTAPPTTGDHIPIMSPVAEAKSIKSPTTSPPLPSPSTSENVSPPVGTPSSDIPAIADASQPIPAPGTSPKKGFTHYLTYPRPSVQAFVGSYIAPLVPKFRGDSKSVAAEKERSSAVTVEEPTVDKAGEKKESEEEKADKVKQQLLIQREKIIARVSVDNRTRALVKGLQRVTDVKLLTSRVEELSHHLLEFPETRGVAIKESVLPCLLRLRQARDLPLQAAVREALALVGYTEPVKGRGIRVLTIDGGGTRGLLALQTLHKLQILTGKRIHQLFDYICGVSTGAILAFMLGIFQIPLEECEEMYRKLGADVFKQNVIVGTVKMGWSHAFYDSQMWENILKERMGEVHMIESARDPNCPKVSAVSAIVNRGLPLKAYVFRNYRLMPGIRSHYLGDCKHKMWQAIRASSAAPGYFQEFVLGKDLHQDGGLLINNPTALAIHECKCLWPNTPLQCVLSLGTGRYETAGKNNTTYTSLKTKLTNVISSATDTEEVHTMLDALLPPDTYFRFNPYMSEDIPLNENRMDKLNFLKSEGARYLERNEAKLRKAASVLGQEKSAIQRLAEWAKLKSDMYEGLPFVSKL